MKIDENLSEVEELLGYKFRNKKLLQIAFTHSSFANEHRLKSNERLEFLGDAVVELIATERLFNEFETSEGKLSKMRAMIVSEKPLADAITAFNLDKYLRKGVGERKNKVESSAIKCDLFEAICGALYLDGGINAAKNFFNKLLSPLFLNIKTLDSVDDPKTRLQEVMKQSNIHYATSKSGEEHNPFYTTSVFVNGVKMGTGQGSNKKTAEENAAAEALTNLKNV